MPTRFIVCTSAEIQIALQQATPEITLQFPAYMFIDMQVLSLYKRTKELADGVAATQGEMRVMSARGFQKMPCVDLNY